MGCTHTPGEAGGEDPIEHQEDDVYVDGAGLTVSPAAALVLLGVLVVLVVAASTRVVPEHERVVVTRWGRVVRVSGPGPAMRVPGLERWQLVSLRPRRMQLGVSGTSSDGVPVHVQVRAECRTVEPSLTARARPEAYVATQAALESLMAREVARAEVSDLLGLRLALEGRIAAELDATTSTYGVRVDAVEIDDIEVRLTMTLVESLRNGGRSGRDR